MIMGAPEGHSESPIGKQDTDGVPHSTPPPTDPRHEVTTGPAEWVPRPQEITGIWKKQDWGTGKEV